MNLRHILRSTVTAVILAGAVVVGQGAAPAATKPGEPVLTVVDNTGGQWYGVRAAAVAWSRTPYLRVRFAADCDKPTYCVVLDAWSHQRSGWMGLATPLTPRIAHVQLNTSAFEVEYDDTLTNDQLQQAIVCHELGHVIGLAHPAPATGPRFGCLANSDHQHTTPHPTEADKVLLRAAAANPYTAAWGLLRWNLQNPRTKR